jgi:NAD(P)-dependent dehydrogenase (short-subunit alcohol dehydrogenase family)
MLLASSVLHTSVETTSTIMTGTVILTGANGSLALPAVKYLLSAYPTFTLVLTVRDDSDQDRNTAELRRIMSEHASSAAFVRKLDLASLEEVKGFSDHLQSEIEDGKLPRLVAIVCNAMSWQLSGNIAHTKDGYETTFAINHLAHFALSLRLLGTMDAQRGRIVFLGSEAHRPEQARLSKGFPTHIPDDPDLLVHPLPVRKEEEMGRGFQRYGTSKLAITMVMYELNRRFKMVSNSRSP